MAFEGQDGTGMQGAHARVLMRVAEGQRNEDSRQFETGCKWVVHRLWEMYGEFVEVSFLGWDFWVVEPC